MVTLKEIAKAAGVSTATVSNVINGKENHVSEETVSHIREIIQQLGYIPNEAARSLAQRKTRVVALIQQGTPGENILTNPYNAVYIGALTSCLSKKGYYPMIRVTDDYKSIEQDIRGWNVAGCLFSGSFGVNLKHLQFLKTVPVVFADCYLEFPDVNVVALDDEAGGRLAGDYLTDMGHRRIAFIASSLKYSEVDQHRLSGFRESLARHGLSMPDAFIYPDSNLDQHMDRLANLMADPGTRPTAFFCCADITAAILIKRFSQLGLRVPQDVSILGFDNLPLASYCTPCLTTISQDIPAKAEAVTDMLIRHIEDSQQPPERVLLGVRIVERESVARIQP